MMNVSSLTSLTGYSSSTALALLQQTSEATTSTGFDGETKAKGAPPPPPPGPPPSQSGGAEAQSLFEALAANDDADGDGMLSQAEIDASPVADLLSEQFASLDADGDGLLNQTEIDSAESASRSGGPGGMGGMGAMPPPPPGPPPGAQSDSTDTADATSSAQSLYESLFSALSTQEDSTTSVTLDRDLANQFLSLLKDIA